MVVDSSILLAIVFQEPPGKAAQEYLDANRFDLEMSTVNYAESLIMIHNRQPRLFWQLKDLIDSSTIELIPPSAIHAEMAALSRSLYPLNLGDCFAYALAKERSVPVITLDRDFLKSDVKVVMPGR